jgi:putative chitinase
MITKQNLINLGVTPALAADWIDPLVSAMSAFSINTPKRMSAFLAQILHESAGFTHLTENLNYRPSALMATFNTKTNIRFPAILAEQFGRTNEHPANQTMIAMIAYANRYGNGGVESGDGWRYRGRGPIQLTFKGNYRECGKVLGIDLVADPDRLLEPVIGARAAGWFWNQGNGLRKSLNVLADQGKIDDISRAINGGTNGLEERRALYQKALKELS